MKVLLLQDVENVGKKYEVKEVKPGFARNFLIPNNMVKLATKQNLKWLKTQKEIIEKQAEEDLKESQELASRLDGMELVIAVKVGPQGQLFESVNSAKIVEVLKGMGFAVKKSFIQLKEPIKEVGEFPVTLRLNHNLEVELRVIVTEEKQ